MIPACVGEYKPDPHSRPAGQPARGKMHLITFDFAPFFLRSVGWFSGSKTPQKIIDLGLTFRRKLCKRGYFGYFLRTE